MEVLTNILSMSIIMLTQLVILSAIVVCITNGVKKIVAIKDIKTARVAFISSLAIILVTGCGILKAFNFTAFIPSIQFFSAMNNVMTILFFIVDWIGTSFIISRGSNSIHDLMKKIKPIEVPTKDVSAE